MAALATVYGIPQDKPLPSLPASPTLTNPDMVLPDCDDNAPSQLSPPQASRRRPPSPSYLRHRTDEDHDGARSTTPPAKKEKRGLMSRKMMLLRSRTGSEASTAQHLEAVARGPPSASDGASDEYDATYASSPTLMDVGNLAPPEQETCQNTSDGSLNSDETAGLPSFLAKYERAGDVGMGDELSDPDTPPKPKYEYSVSVEGNYEAQRKQQEEDEHQSAILSKRAEEILANAKKRLNLMEGNLRGARDLVTPLTAANLKRATSLGSSYQSPYRTRNRYAPDRYNHDPSGPLPVRVLHSQASSPAMGHEYASHTRNLSAGEVPERPYTALEGSSSIMRGGRIPVHVSNASWTHGLRSSRSHDSFGSSAARDRPLRPKGSPDANLAPLPEDDGNQQTSARQSTVEDGGAPHGLGIHHSPSSRTDGLRDQMTSLRGRISTLKERAREDSLRRQSLLSLRTTSPLNNATASPPEFFYMQGQNYGSPALDAKAGVGWTSQNNSPASPKSAHSELEQSAAVAGSRNAFAEQATSQQPRDQPTPDNVASTNIPRKSSSESQSPQQSVRHKQTPSGTTIVGPAANRYSHHQYSSSDDTLTSDVQSQHAPDSNSDYYDSDSWPLSPVKPSTSDYKYDESEDEGESVYEDAEYEQAPVLAHEDRDDAFDYEHFFLHSAMGSYGGHRSNSSESGETTTSSSGTARGPTYTDQEDDGDDFDDFDPESGIFPPPTPETPERLREIERNLHKRKGSSESTSTLATFATADEGRTSPTTWSGQETAADWPILPSDATPRPGSRPSAQLYPQPSTAARHTLDLSKLSHNGSFGRADSGLGLPHRSFSRQEHRLPPVLTTKSPNNSVSSPPMSPPMLHDPASIAVNALLDPHGRMLGLKDKATLFSLIESLKKVCARLQEEDEGQYETRMLRRGLDDAKKALDGTLRQMSGTS